MFAMATSSLRQQTERSRTLKDLTTHRINCKKGYSSMRAVVEFFASGSTIDEVYSNISSKWNDLTAGKYGDIPQSAEVKIRTNSDVSHKDNDLVAYITVRVKIGE